MRRLTQNEQRELQNRMEKKQMKEFMNVSRHSIALTSEFGGSGEIHEELTWPDVLQSRPAMLRFLRQWLREQVPHLARGGLRYAMCRQAHEGLAAPR